VCFSLRDKPIEQLFAKAFGAVVRCCDQVVDVHEFSVGKVFGVAIARHGADFAAGLAIGEDVAFGPLPKYLCQHRWFVQVRAQLMQDRPAPSDLDVVGSNSDGGCGHNKTSLSKARPVEHKPRTRRLDELNTRGFEEFDLLFRGVLPLVHHPVHSIQVRAGTGLDDVCARAFTGDKAAASEIAFQVDLA
jgi:hypothetical protein